MGSRTVIVWPGEGGESEALFFGSLCSSSGIKPVKQLPYLLPYRPMVVAWGVGEVLTLGDIERIRMADGTLFAIDHAYSKRPGWLRCGHGGVHSLQTPFRYWPAAGRVQCGVTPRVLLARMSTKAADAMGFNWDAAAQAALQKRGVKTICRDKPTPGETAPSIEAVVQSCNGVVTHHSNSSLAGLLMGVPTWTAAGPASVLNMYDTLGEFVEALRSDDGAQVPEAGAVKYFMHTLMEEEREAGAMASYIRARLIAGGAVTPTNA